MRRDFPLAVVLSGANTHDVKLLEETLDHIVVLHPESDEEHLYAPYPTPWRGKERTEAKSGIPGPPLGR